MLKSFLSQTIGWESAGLPLKTNIEERSSGSPMCQLKPREGKKDKRQKTKDKSKVIAYYYLLLANQSNAITAM